LTGDPMIRLSDVRKTYGEVEALRGVSLRVERGRVTVVIGPSGCGKSTLLRCINLLEIPDSGAVEVGQSRFVFGPQQRAPRGRTLAQFRSHIGMVFQQFDLFPHLTVLANVMEGPIVVKQVAPARAKELALLLLDKVGMAEKAAAYPRQLSGGQAQRVAIARALAMAPEVMLFDEVTSSLDPELVGEVLNVMRQLVHEGTTMVVVTHEIAFAYDVADTVVFMDDGRIAAAGTASEMLERPSNPRLHGFLSRFRESWELRRPDSKRALGH
jgi:ABC-type polar amino acid transport system ATPase subunit